MDNSTASHLSTSGSLVSSFRNNSSDDLRSQATPLSSLPTGSQLYGEVSVIAGLSSLGLALNVLVILAAAATVRQLRALHVLLLLHAAGDCLVILLYIPSYILSMLTDTIRPSGNVCVISASALIISLLVSSASHFVLAVSRVILSCSQKQYKRWFNVGRTIGYVCCLSLIGTALIIVNIVYSSIFGSAAYVGTMATICVRSGYRIAAYVRIAVPILFTSLHLIIIVSYLVIFLKIRSVRDSGDRIQRDCRNGALTCAMAAVVFSICWAPILTLTSLDPYQEMAPPLTHRIALYALILSTIINPLAFAFRTTDFRRGFRKIFRLHQKPSTSESLYRLEFQELDAEFRSRHKERAGSSKNVSRLSRRSRFSTKRRSKVSQAVEEGSDVMKPDAPRTSEMVNDMVILDPSKLELHTVDKTYINCG